MLTYFVFPSPPADLKVKEEAWKPIAEAVDAVQGVGTNVGGGGGGGGIGGKKGKGR